MVALWQAPFLRQPLFFRTVSIDPVMKWKKHSRKELYQIEKLHGDNLSFHPQTGDVKEIAVFPQSSTQFYLMYDSLIFFVGFVCFDMFLSFILCYNHVIKYHTRSDTR